MTADQTSLQRYTSLTCFRKMGPVRADHILQRYLRSGECHCNMGPMTADQASLQRCPSLTCFRKMGPVIADRILKRYFQSGECHCNMGPVTADQTSLQRCLTCFRKMGPVTANHILQRFQSLTNFLITRNQRQQIRTVSGASQSGECPCNSE